MKIKKLSLHNFRQFYGKNTVEFSIDKNQNITVIHGENGAGKTSLLNAFKWCFYGKTDFDSGNDSIVNEHAISSANINDVINCYVTVEFERDGRQYTAKRAHNHRKIQGLDTQPLGGTTFELTYINENGKYESADNPDTHINQILPEKMHSYFLFNGERIEKLAYASSSHEIRDAIKNLMGLEIVERGRDHIAGRIKKHFSSQIMSGASAELADIIKQDQDLVDQIEQLKTELETEQNNISQCDTEITFIGNKLKGLEATSELQNKREQYSKRIKEIESLQEDIQKNIKKIISEKGFLSFIETVTKKVTNILEDRRKKGELPYVVKQQFLDDLINKRECICGTPLVSGSEQLNRINGFKKTAAADGVEEAFIKTAGALSQVDSSRQEFLAQIRKEIETQAKYTDEKKSLTNLLEDIETKILNIDLEQAVELEKKKKEQEAARDKSVMRTGWLEIEISKLKTEHEKVILQRKNIEQKSEHAKLAQKRHSIAEECARVLSLLAEVGSNNLREKLSQRVNETFQKILQKDYWAEIDEHYRLQTFKEIPGHGSHLVKEKSTGEGQVTSLSFIGSIVSMAKEKRATEQTFFKSGVFPIIMDSPFGNMDPTYKEAIAKYLPELAEQIIILVSTSQWKGEVERECTPRVGAHISLIYHAPKVGNNKESHYVRADSQYEYSEFEDGYHG